MPLEQWTKNVSGLLAIVSTALGVYVYIETNFLNERRKAIEVRMSRLGEQTEALKNDALAINNELAQQRKVIDLNADRRADVTAEREHIIAVYGKVQDALSSGDTKRQEIAIALISTLSSPELRSRLAASFAQAPNAAPPAIQNAAVEIKRSADAAVQRQLVEGWRRWKFAVLFCRDTPSNAPLAEQIAALLRDDGFPRVEIRAWADRNEPRLGRPPRGVEVRPDPAEKSSADYLKSLLEAGNIGAVSIYPIIGNTRDYVSIFVCN